MVYCSIGDSSDVYLYRTDPSASSQSSELYRAIVCHGCQLSHGMTCLLSSPRVALEHLGDHRTAGQQVPEAAFEALRREWEEMQQWPAR